MITKEKKAICNWSVTQIRSSIRSIFKRYRSYHLINVIATNGVADPFVEYEHAPNKCRESRQARNASSSGTNRSINDKRSKLILSLAGLTTNEP